MGLILLQGSDPEINNTFAWDEKNLDGSFYCQNRLSKPYWGLLFYGF
ncbi:hypothetical protein D1BOALGB6SA_3035 [Olavius sp. associated proteobacterium Delta 1]|nr:hypothetical protein D1BOALGB6SA_3035 [Olavius sp. associated proteobacterium Delta 1]